AALQNSLSFKALWRCPLRYPPDVLCREDDQTDWRTHGPSLCVCAFPFDPTGGTSMKLKYLAAGLVASISLTAMSAQAADITYVSGAVGNAVEDFKTIVA